MIETGFRFGKDDDGDDKRQLNFEAEASLGTTSVCLLSATLAIAVALVAHMVYYRETPGLLLIILAGLFAVTTVHMIFDAAVQIIAQFSAMAKKGIKFIDGDNDWWKGGLEDEADE